MPLSIAIETDGRQLKLVLISDLHYEPSSDNDRGLLVADRMIKDLSPDLLIVSGDLTKQGLTEQLLPVVQFLKGIGMERVRAIPGNRDYLGGGGGPLRPVDSDFDFFLVAPDTPDVDDYHLPADSRIASFVEAFDDVEFFDRMKDMTLVGLDSEPRITDEALRRALAYFDGSSPKATRVFVTHRSLLPVPRKKLKEGDLLPNAGDILASLSAARVDLVLCAHLHRVHAWQLSDGAHTMAVVNAPSLLDTSPGKENGLLEIEIGKRGDMRVMLHPLDGGSRHLLLERGDWRKGKGRAA